MPGTATTNLPLSDSADDVVANAAGSTVRVSMARLAALLGTLQGPAYGSETQLQADTAWPAGAIGSVYGGTAAQIGVYRKSGSPGSGSWSRIGDLPVSSITAAQLAAKADVSALADEMAARINATRDAGVLPLANVAGAADAITADIAPAVPGVTLSVLSTVELIPAADNTGAVTLNVAGAGAWPVYRRDGNQLQAGDLKTNVSYLLGRRGSAWRMISAADSEPRPITAVAGLQGALDLKASVAGLRAEADARALSDQKAATDVARLDEQMADPLRKAPLLPTHRPGDTPWLHGSGIAGGDPYALAPVTNVAVAAEGAVARIVGAGIISDRHLHAMEPDRQYGVRFAVRRAVNTPDPAGDAVRLAMAWYDRNGAHLSTTTLENLTALTVASGRQVRSFTVARAAAPNVVAAPANAIYGRPFVQGYGTGGQTDVEVIAWRDITDLAVWSPDVGALSSRLVAVESLGVGGRLDTLEAEVGTPSMRRYKTVAEVAAATIPASVDVVEVLGRAVAGDRGAAPYRRVGAEPAHAGKIRSADGAWWEIEPVEVRVEQFATPAAAVSHALAKGRRVVNVDAAVALADGRNRSNVILRGDGVVEGTNIDGPGYRRPVVPDNAPTARAMPDRWLIGDRFMRKSSVQVVVVGDSLTTYGADVFTAQDSLTGYLEVALRRANPGRAITVTSRGIGAQNFNRLDSVPTVSYPIGDRYPWYTDPSRPWLNYVADLAPDVVVLSSGMNDQAGFDRAAFESVVAKVLAMPSKPQIVIATNIGPNLSPDAAYAAYGSFAGQEGRDYVAGYLRTYADFYGHSLIDIGRTFGIVRDGRDVLDTYFEQLPEEVFQSAVGYVAPLEASCRDFTARMTVVPDAWSKATTPFSAKLSNAADGVAFIRDSGGYLRFTFYDGGPARRDVISDIPTPISIAQVEITVKGSQFSFRVVPASSGWDAGVKPFTQTVIRHGGIFRPTFLYFAGGGAGGVMSMKLGVGKEQLYVPSITDRELWGEPSASSGMRAATGGNGINHPSSRGASAIYGLHFGQQSYPMPYRPPYSVGDTLMARVDGAETIGVHASIGGDRLWPATANGASGPTRPAALNGTMWESLGVVIGTDAAARTTLWRRIS